MLKFMGWWRFLISIFNPVDLRFVSLVESKIYKRQVPYNRRGHPRCKYTKTRRNQYIPEKVEKRDLPMYESASCLQKRDQ